MGISLFSLGGINLLVVNFNAQEKVSVQYLPATTTITRLLLLFFASKSNSISRLFFTLANFTLANWRHGDIKPA